MFVFEGPNVGTEALVAVNGTVAVTGPEDIGTVLPSPFVGLISGPEEFVIGYGAVAPLDEAELPDDVDQDPEPNGPKEPPMPPGPVLGVLAVEKLEFEGGIVGVITPLKPGPEEPDIGLVVVVNILVLLGWLFVGPMFGTDEFVSGKGAVVSLAAVEG